MSRIAAIFAVLAAGTAAVVGAALFLSGPSGISGFEPAEGEIVFPDLADRLDDVSTVIGTGTGGTSMLIGTNGQWRIRELDGYPVAPERVRSVLEALAELRALYVSAGEAPPLEQVGVARPAESEFGTGTSLTLLDGNGEPIIRASFGHTITVPTEGGMRTLSVVRRNGGDRVWLLDTTLLVPVWPLDWLDQNLIHVPRESAVTFSSTPPGGEPLVIRRGESGSLAVERGAGGGMSQEAEDRLLEQQMAVLENVSFVDVRTVAGVDVPGAEPWRASLTAEDGTAYRVSLYGQGAEAWAVLSAATEGRMSEAARAFNARHAAWAYRLTPSTITRLMVTADSL